MKKLKKCKGSCRGLSSRKNCVRNYQPEKFSPAVFFYVKAVKVLAVFMDKTRIKFLKTMILGLDFSKK